MRHQEETTVAPASKRCSVRVFRPNPLAPPIRIATEAKLATAAKTTKMKIAARAESCSLAACTLVLAPDKRIRVQASTVTVQAKTFQMVMAWADHRKRVSIQP